MDSALDRIPRSSFPTFSSHSTTLLIWLYMKKEGENMHPEALVASHDRGVTQYEMALIGIYKTKISTLGIMGWRRWTDAAALP